MTVIAMGGLSGGGGRSLGPLVAQRFGYDYVDRLILTNLASEVGATVEALHQREERPPTRGERFSRILRRVLESSAVTSTGGDPYFGPGAAAFLTDEYEDLPQTPITIGHELEDEKYIQAVRKVVSDLAAADNVVIVGRGAYIILKDTPGVLRVGTVARLEDRIATIMGRESIGRKEAENVISARDMARSHSFERFFGIDQPDRPDLYHIVINTSEVSLEYATEIIVQAVSAFESGKLSAKAVPIGGPWMSWRSWRKEYQ